MAPAKPPPASVKVRSQRNKPVRSPRRAARHHRVKRSEVLKLLGAASYINGSQFALLLVNPAGEVETFASEALQIKLSVWFNKKIISEAKECTEALRKRQREQIGFELDSTAGNDREEVNSSKGLGAQQVYSMKGAIQDLDLPQEEDSESDSGSDSDLSREFHAQPNRKGNQIQSNGENQSSFNSPTTPALNKSANNSTKSMSTELPNSWLTTPSQPAVVKNSSVQRPPHSPAPNPLSSRTGANVSSQLVAHTFTPTTLDDWFTNKLSVLPQKTSKTVCKLWIKVCEPDKKAEFPYNLGDDAKPAWWPQGVRHKEPDHLHKPERIALLSTLIRKAKKPLAEFEMATAKATALIPAVSIPVLSEVYKVAKEEAKARLAGSGTFESITVMLVPVAEPVVPERGEQQTPNSNATRKETLQPKTVERTHRHTARRSITNTPQPRQDNHSTVSPRPRTIAHPYTKSLSRSTCSSVENSQPASHGMTKSLSLSGHGLTLDGVIGTHDKANLNKSARKQVLEPAINLAGSATEPVTAMNSTAQNSPREAEPSFASPAMIKSRSRLINAMTEQTSPLSASQSAAANIRTRNSPEQTPITKKRAISGKHENGPIHVNVHPGHGLQQPQYSTEQLTYQPVSTYATELQPAFAAYPTPQTNFSMEHSPQFEYNSPQFAHTQPPQPLPYTHTSNAVYAQQQWDSGQQSVEYGPQQSHYSLGAENFYSTSPHLPHSGLATSSAQTQAIYYYPSSPHGAANYLHAPQSQSYAPMYSQANLTQQENFELNSANQAIEHEHVGLGVYEQTEQESMMSMYEPIPTSGYLSEEQRLEEAKRRRYQALAFGIQPEINSY